MPADDYGFERLALAVALTKLDQCGNRHNGHPIPGTQRQQLIATRHSLTVGAADLAKHRGRFAPGQGDEIDARLGMPFPFEHAVRTGKQGKHVTRPDKVVRCAGVSNDLGCRQRPISGD